MLFIILEITAIPLINFSHNFKNSFFLQIEWNQLDPKENILQFITMLPNSVFQCHSPERIKYLTRLQLNVSHHRHDKFKHSFKDILNPLSTCSLGEETASNFILLCSYYKVNVAFFLPVFAISKALFWTETNLTLLKPSLWK